MIKGFVAICSIVLLGVLAVAPGCSTKSTGAPPDLVTIRGAGSTFVAPLFQKWCKEYHQQHSGTLVDYQAVGSGEGARQFLADAVDFGASDAALTDEQIASAQQGAVLVPVAAGSVVLAYNPEGMPLGLRLPRPVYVDIFLGKITRWDDARIREANPDAKLPRRDIAVVVRLDGSGTTFALTNHLAAVSPQWRKSPGVGTKVGWPCGPMQANGNQGVAGVIQRGPGTIGYVEYGIAKRAGLGMSRLQNKAGKFVEPTGTSGLATLIGTKMPANLRVFEPDPDGPESYPIVTYSWLLLYGKYGDAKKLGALKDVVRWCLDEGQQYNESLGYIRLPPDLIAKATHALDSITTN